MKKALRRITALALAAMTAGALGLSAAADVDYYKWEASKTLYPSGPSNAGSTPDFANFYYSPNGYTTHLMGIKNSSINATGELFVTCNCTYASMGTVVMREIGSLLHKVDVDGAVTNGIPFTYTASTDVYYNTYTANGETIMEE